MARDEMRCEVKLEIIPARRTCLRSRAHWKKVGREASMLHLEVLLLIYHCARSA